MSMTTTKMKLKLFINKNTNKVMYAETGKDFVDLLVHTFKQPLGYAMQEIFHGFISGALATLHTSVAEDLSVDYLLQGPITKASFLSPKVPKLVYYCIYCNNVESDVYRAKCPRCKRRLVHSNTALVVPPENKIEIGQGHVKGEITYLITDELAVKPLFSSTVTINLLSQLGINDLGCIQESEITLDADQVLELVKRSLTSKTVLTDTFLALLKTQVTK